MTDLEQLTDYDRTLLASLAEKQSEMMAQVIDWARINSGSYNKVGLERQAEKLEEAFSILDAEIETLPTKPISSISNTGQTQEFQSGPVLRIRSRLQANRRVVLTGHYDTVFAPGVFEDITHLDGGRIGGPGVADMKGGLCVMLEALAAFETHGQKDRLSYEVVLSPDEEIGSFASADFLHEAAKRAEIGLTFEPAMDTGELAAARKGSAKFDLIFRGRSAHAGRAPEQGRSAVVAAALFVAELDSLNGVPQGVTFNVGAIDGGGPVNIVPDTAIVRVGSRAPDAESAQWATNEIERLFKKITERDGIGGTFSGGFYRPPKPRNTAQDRIIKDVQATGRAIGLDLNFSNTGGVCEGNNLFAAGTPNIDTLGVRGGRIHSNAEFMEPESLPERAGLAGLILNRIADGRLDASAIKALMGADRVEN